MNEDKITADLISHTPEPEQTVVKLLHQLKDAHEKIGKKQNDDIIKDIIRSNNLSAIEHVSFTFVLKGISQISALQILERKFASVLLPQDLLFSPNYLIPPAIDNDNASKAIYIKLMNETENTYNTIKNNLKEKEYSDDETAYNLKYILPNALSSTIIVTMNARELLQFFLKHCCNKSQSELHLIGDKMIAEIKQLAPNIFENAGPGCLSGSCAEGDLTCGKIVEVRKKYKIIQ
ncbi:FAD-dependent thymidylate synthase [Candidatus Magnetoovum chiemensis]|nr:FAD-dependent thymidylate synthase [Candidatus Magnetoovum chiemensis]